LSGKEPVDNESALERAIKIRNKYGIHARPAAMLVKTAGLFRSEITIEKDGTKVSGSSIMGLLTLEGSHGSTLKLTAVGDDAGEALDALESLFKSKFNED
jgi:phosphocarrier protein